MNKSVALSPNHNHMAMVGTCEFAAVLTLNRRLNVESTEILNQMGPNRTLRNRALHRHNLALTTVQLRDSDRWSVTS